MYLKSIEVQGFKSFADKIVFQFHSGITAIVGPNGSGKSNVADAVRWVLGEQSAKSLRGSNMQDVIFAGTQSRRPLGMAAVTITLDNSDQFLSVPYEEVSVTRRVYRSGESEYLLNGTQVRLRDIQELFYDTGIGQEGYSIIGQGQIDKILSSKPEDRRELFDEAAGIVKFKRRKGTALKKLDTERANLTRVNDILSEIQRQLGPLKEQAQTAKIYLQKREEMKRYDVNLFLLEEEKTQRDLDSLSEKLKITEDQLSDARLEYERTRKQYELAEQQIEQMDATLQDKREEDAKRQLESQQQTGRIEILREQINTSRTSDEHFNARLNAISEQKKALDAQESEALTQKEEQEKKLAEVGEEYSKSLSISDGLKEECQNLEKEIDKNKSAVIELLNQRANLKAGMQRYDTMSEQLQIRKAELTQELLRLRSEEESQKNSLKEAQDDFDSISDRIQKIREKSSEIKASLEKTQTDFHDLSQKMEEDRLSYTRLVSRLESMKNIAERYDGYSSSIRRVMERRKKESGILGVVADLIHVKKEYEIAIETALGGSIQNIVTDTEETAKRQISFLKENRYGRVTFLPLTALHDHGGFSTPQALKENGVIGLASDLVETKERYKILATSLLGRTIVVKNMDQAIALANKYAHSLRIVTLDGELLSPGGSMSGGAYKNSGNLLGRQREIHDLENEVEKAKIGLDEKGKKLEETQQELDNLTIEDDRLKEDLQKETLAQNTAKLYLDECNEKSHDAATSAIRLHDENEEIKEQEQEISENLEKGNEDLTQSEREEKLIEFKTGQLQKQLDEQRQKEADASAGAHEIQLSYSRCEQSLNFLSQDLERIQKEKERLEKEREEIENEVNSSAGDVREKEEEIKAISESLQEEEEQREKRRKEIDDLSNEREKISRSNKQFFSDREELSEKMSLLDKESFRLQTQKEKIEEQKESRINAMWEEYSLTYDSALELKDESYKAVTPLRKNLAAVKNEIRELGDVNVNAISDYEELSQRETFLSSQQEDLQKAEASLLKVIDELDNGMRSQFSDEFTKIQKEFSKTFRELFGGGKGTIELVEGEDILDAGILINAQPPGKKLQNMMQLSGGERALTAIALLFAIQNLKPSPFCLLDEIEAALDESNVDRFAQYLRRLTKNTQFIIITHRRGAMSAADRLYGITMQEKGVSALVSVNLIESELDE